MSKKVAILEGDKSRRFSGVKYLRTDLSGGGACEWVPEDEKKLTTKTIKKNGTYNIKDEKGNYYGFSQVTVSVKNSVTGKKKPSTGGDGNEYHVKTNDDNMLEETLLPSSIRIVTQPTKTEYTNGESISLGGAVVKAYKADGGLWEGQGYSSGVIPHGELTLDPTIASGGTSDPYAEMDGYTVPYCAPSQAYTAFGSSEKEKQKNTYGYAQVSGGSTIYAVMWSGPYGRNEGVKLFSLQPFSGTARGYDGGTVQITATNDTDDGLSYWWVDATGTMSDNYSNIEYAPPKCSAGMNNKLIAKALFNGTHHGGSTAESVAVKWNRPEDEKELSDTFNITVTASNGGTGEGTGGAGGGGGTSW